MCPQENKILTKRDEKRTKYRQLAFELRERRVQYKIYVIPVVIGALGRGIEESIFENKKIFKLDDLYQNIVGEMQKKTRINRR